jgi:DNA-directed RNA polymerase specialized sigma24 family protein
MDAPPRKGRGRGAGPDSPNGILDAYARIQCLCISAGLPSFDAEDVTQDVFMWLLRNGPLLALPAMPFLAAVVRNFIKRYQREKGCQRRVEGVPLEDTAEQPVERPDALESKEILDRLVTVLPETERRLLAMIRSGYTASQAARVLEIPRGSRAFHKERLIDCARRELHPRELPPASLQPHPTRARRSAPGV